MSKLAAASLAIDARLSSMQDAIRDVLAAVDGCAAWDVTLVKIDALRPFSHSSLADRPLNIIPPSLVIDPAPSSLRIVPPAACHLCNPSEVCGLCKASLEDSRRPTRESERAMKRLAEAAVAWHGLRDDEMDSEIMPPAMSEACAVDAAVFGLPILHQPPADPTDAYTMDGSQVCAFCNRPSYGSRLCCGCAAEQSGLG